ncbi:hypothetical protein NUU61_006522 [Penicillium alfredii]|uniref:Translation initiation factor 3 N-terminal domain-containing protein n=1 Tax=Penicillium alfredii TaxID=1506179 RepID=A0A9W9K4C1_9EURO|nr:uncharacterized protein NUU61_006522 [Penicillium alfredii]KAJ5091652.1 hypothetical protein NUU61_006522 [Penicillium alfredii]
MKHTRGLVSTAQALRQVFLAPLPISRSGLVPVNQFQHNGSSRAYHQSSRLAFPDPPAPPKGPLKNEAIRAPFVQVVNENNSLDPPMRLSDVLASFDRDEYFLVQVSPSDSEQAPICKILNKAETWQNEKARAKLAKTNKAVTKQIELNWAIDAHDLSHRLNQLKKFLDKGRKVEIVLTRKKHKRAPTVDEIKHVMQSVIETSKEAGATQVKGMEGEPGKHVIITVKKENL